MALHVFRALYIQQLSIFIKPNNTSYNPPRHSGSKLKFQQCRSLASNKNKFYWIHVVREPSRLEKIEVIIKMPCHALRLCVLGKSAYRYEIPENF